MAKKYTAKDFASHSDPDYAAKVWNDALDEARRESVARERRAVRQSRPR